MKNLELNNLIYDAIREHHSGQINLASEASAINLAESISGAICKRFHIAKRRNERHQHEEEKVQLSLDLLNY